LLGSLERQHLGLNKLPKNRAFKNWIRKFGPRPFQSILTSLLKFKLPHVGNHWS